MATTQSGPVRGGGPPAVSADIQVLRIAALEAHRTSLGQGEALVDILKDTIDQLKMSHQRVQLMSQALFAAGLVVLAVGLVEVTIGDEGAWGAIVGGLGGLTAFVATFFAAPMDRISRPVAQLVRLETVFLGYIRILGELDSAFQMQYLDIVAGTSNATIDQVIRDHEQRRRRGHEAGDGPHRVP